MPENTDNFKYTGLQLARLSGKLLGAGIIYMAIHLLYTEASSLSYPKIIKSILYIIIGVSYFIPWKNIQPQTLWLRLFIPFCMLTFAFVFTLIFSAMFTYIDLTTQNIKPGIPAFEGTLIFFALMQIPVIIFERNPKLLN